MSFEKDGVFCLHVQTARENYVGRFLKNVNITGLKLNVIAAFSERYVVKNGKSKKETRPLIPGYVFFSCRGAPDWKKIDWIPAVYKPLSYADNSFALRGRDLEFIASLMKNNGVYKISRAVSEGSKIRIIDGPLKDFEGNIIKVNRRKGKALIRIPGDSILNNIWLGIELLDLLKNPAGS